ncbi:MAG: SCO family protein [Rhodocyclales bacterium]|nr:SCO family protein [Rhodocyclales bacterium]
MLDRRSLLLALIGLLAGCGEAVPSFHATNLGQHSKTEDFAAKLHDFYGRPQNLANFRGKLVILFFGYTTCPDICPSALAKYAALLRQPGISAQEVQVVFVTLDPARDSAARLAEYLTWFDPSFIGLRGDAQSTAAVARQFRITATRKDIPGSMGYVLDHSAGAYVIDRRGQTRLYLSENAKIDEIATDLRILLAEKP